MFVCYYIFVFCTHPLDLVLSYHLCRFAELNRKVDRSWDVVQEGRSGGKNRQKAMEEMKNEECSQQSNSQH